MLKLIKSHPQVLSFCFAGMFFSCLGQTFLLSLLNPLIQNDLGHSMQEISTVYSLATFTASFGLPFLGRLLDRWSTFTYCVMTASFLLLGTIILGFSKGLIGLFVSYLLIRGFGQVNVGMIATTTISKLFGRYRGRALSVASVGRSLGEMLFPMMLNFLIIFVGWQKGMMSLGFIFALIFIPLSYLLARKIGPGTLAFFDENITKKGPDKAVREVLKDSRVYLLLFANLIIPFVLTGLFFQQAAIAEMKNWGPTLYTSSFTVYGTCQFLALMGSGLFIDRFTARRMLSVILIPLLLAIYCLLYVKGPLSCPLYLGLAGMSAGFSVNSRASFYAEIFGTQNLGSIKGVDSTLLVMATSFSTFIYAFILGRGIALESLLRSLSWLVMAGLFCYILVSIVYKKDVEPSDS